MVAAAQWLIRTGGLTRRIAVIGASEAGRQLAGQLADPDAGICLVGLYDERRTRLPESDGVSATVEPLSSLYKLLYRGRVDEIVIAIPHYAADRILDLSQRFLSRQCRSTYSR